MPKTIFTGANLAVVEVVKEARLAAGLRQADLAALVGRDQSWISLIEGSQRRLDVVEFIELARAIGVEPVDLFSQVARQIASGHMKKSGN
jgi:transcriptional regulator with XRE-family HTH domain